MKNETISTSLLALSILYSITSANHDYYEKNGNKRDLVIKASRLKYLTKKAYDNILDEIGCEETAKNVKKQRPLFVQETYDTWSSTLK